MKWLSSRKQLYAWLVTLKIRLCSVQATNLIPRKYLVRWLDTTSKLEVLIKLFFEFLPNSTVINFVVQSFAGSHASQICISVSKQTRIDVDLQKRNTPHWSEQSISRKVCTMNSNLEELTPIVMWLKSHDRRRPNGFDLHISSCSFGREKTIGSYQIIALTRSVLYDSLLSICQQGRPFIWTWWLSRIKRQDPDLHLT